jgi:hypothetical protein
MAKFKSRAARKEKRSGFIISPQHENELGTLILSFSLHVGKSVFAFCGGVFFVDGATT